MVRDAVEEVGLENHRLKQEHEEAKLLIKVYQTAKNFATTRVII